MRDTAKWLLAIGLAPALCALAYALFRLVPGPAGPPETAAAESFHWRDVRTVRGVVLRTEQLLPAQDAPVVFRCAEGQRVAAGEPLGVTAASGEAFFRGWLLLRLEDDLDAAEGGPALSDAAFAGECARLRAAAGRRSFDDAAAAAERLQLRLFPDESRRTRLRAEVEALRAAGAGEAVLLSPASGWFCRATDGWEGVSAVTAPRALEAMTARGREPTAAAGRLVTGSSWRLACAVDTAEASLFPVGNSFRIELGGAVLEAEVTGLFPGSGGRSVVLFTGRTGLGALLNERFVEAVVVLAEADGLLLPALAVREEAGESVVYRPAGRFVRRETVTVLARPEGGVLVRSGTLRPGSEVLLDGGRTDGGARR